ncbi:MAG TPA: anthranilate phosphoribosyltransferase [Acidimicrobiales bacterium]|jgi:anthranilate phosphoribosyltransferase|nr:anthranilate phosphoribosyltransferase [Acidimicrobiales bacterium]
MAGSFSSDVLNPLVRGTDLERGQARAALVEILEGHVEGVLIASFLTALTAKGETADEMTGFIDAMIEAASTFTIGPDVIDIVGTGGDQLHTVNISTMAALTVAGCGVPVAKHGNRAASSSVGSADLLEALGVRLDAPEEVVRACVAGAGIGFMFAPTFHHGLGYLTPIRRALGFRTIFNVLGPLANPALVRRTLIGVAQAPLLDAMTQVLMARGIDHAILVNADDGLDELSLGSSSTLHVITARGSETQRLDAGAVLGLHHNASSIRGGDTAHNVEVARGFLDGRRGPVFDVVCANAALALIVAGRATTLTEGFDLASASVTDGRAALALERLVELSNA